MSTYRSDAVAPAQGQPDGFRIDSQTPLRPTRLESEVLVPLAQTLITALIGAAVLGVIAWRAGWPAEVPLFGFVGGLAIMWLWRLWRTDRLLWRLEQISGQDVNGDGAIGRPAPIALIDPAKARQKASAGAAEEWRKSRAEELVRFVGQCASVPRPSEKALGIESPSQRAQYIERRDALMTLGLAGWNDPDNHLAGWSLRASPDVAAEIIQEHAR